MDTEIAAGLTVSDSVTEAVSTVALESLTLNVRGRWSDVALGVPASVPLEALRASPLGRDELASDQW